MTIQINWQSGGPIYLQIVDQIKQLLATGKLHPGDQLPPVRQLAADLGISPNTVARTYKELNEEGIVSARRGQGTFVSDQPGRLQLGQMRPEKLRSIFSKPFVEALSLGFSMPEIEEAVIEQLTRWWTETRNSNLLA